jgi:O-antigen/teichoic acid export membrane protein
MLRLLFQRFQSLVKTDIIKVFSFTAISTFVKMLTGFISVKVVAVFIGPSGIALLGQLNNFSSIIMTAASGGINNGIIKYVAEHKESPGKVRLLLSTALRITIILSTIIGLFLIFFANYLSRIILFDSSYAYVFVLFGITLTLYTLNGYLMSILNGFKEFHKFVKISIVSSIIGVFFTVGLVYFWQLKGALISAVTYQSIAFFLTALMTLKSPWFATKNFNVRFSKVVLKKYLGYSLMTIVSAATIPVSQLFIRGYVITHLSATEAGWWEGMNRISGMYLMVITSSFGVYYLPRLSEIKEKYELRKEIFTAYKVVVPALILGFLGIYIFRDLIIRILFTADFYPMRNLFAWQLIGDLFKISSWLLAFLMVAKSMTRLYVVTEILFSILFVGLSILFLQNNHVVGVTIANMIVYFIYFITMLIIFRNLIISKID